MTPRDRRWLWLIIGGGVAGRVALAFATVGQGFDIESLRLVASELGEHPLHLYSIVNANSQLGDLELRRWPYPSGIFAWLAVALEGNRLTALPFHGIVQLAPIAGDGLLAWLVQHHLGRNGATRRTRLAAAGLVALGPSFWAISGYHGQIDSVAIAPAVAALVVWDQAPLHRRAVAAGLLIGVGASVKTVPLFMLLALLPSVRSPREAATLVAAAGAVPLLAMAPFLVADFHAVREALGYTGAPGLGGVTMLIQPELARAVLTARFEGVEIGPVVSALHDHTREIVLITVAGAGALLARFRPSPPQGAALVWLALYVTTPSFFFQYAVWGLPFVIMAGYLRQAAILQALLAPATVIFYLLPWSNDLVAPIYVATMGLVWLGWLAALGIHVLRVVRPLPPGPAVVGAS